MSDIEDDLLYTDVLGAMKAVVHPEDEHNDDPEDEDSEDTGGSPATGRRKRASSSPLARDGAEPNNEDDDDDDDDVNDDELFTSALNESASSAGSKRTRRMSSRRSSYSSRGRDSLPGSGSDEENVEGDSDVEEEQDAPVRSTRRRSRKHTQVKRYAAEWTAPRSRKDGGGGGDDDDDPIAKMLREKEKMDKKLASLRKEGELERAKHNAQLQQLGAEMHVAKRDVEDDAPLPYGCARIFPRGLGAWPAAEELPSIAPTDRDAARDAGQSAVGIVLDFTALAREQPQSASSLTAQTCRLIGRVFCGCAEECPAEWCAWLFRVMAGHPDVATARSAFVALVQLLNGRVLDVLDDEYGILPPAGDRIAHEANRCLLSWKLASEDLMRALRGYLEAQSSDSEAPASPSSTSRGVAAASSVSHSAYPARRQVPSSSHLGLVLRFTSAATLRAQVSLTTAETEEVVVCLLRAGLDGDVVRPVELQLRDTIRALVDQIPADSWAVSAQRVLARLCALPTQLAAQADAWLCHVPSRGHAQEGGTSHREFQWAAAMLLRLGALCVLTHERTRALRVGLAQAALRLPNTRPVPMSSGSGSGSRTSFGSGTSAAATASSSSATNKQHDADDNSDSSGLHQVTFATVRDQVDALADWIRQVRNLEFSGTNITVYNYHDWVLTLHAIFDSFVVLCRGLGVHDTAFSDEQRTELQKVKNALFSLSSSLKARHDMGYLMLAESRSIFITVMESLTGDFAPPISASLLNGDDDEDVEEDEEDEDRQPASSPDAAVDEDTDEAAGSRTAPN